MPSGRRLAVLHSPKAGVMHRQTSPGLRRAAPTGFAAISQKPGLSNEMRHVKFTVIGQLWVFPEDYFPVIPQDMHGFIHGSPRHAQRIRMDFSRKSTVFHIVHRVFHMGGLLCFTRRNVYDVDIIFIFRKPGKSEDSPPPPTLAMTRLWLLRTRRERS